MWVTKTMKVHDVWNQSQVRGRKVTTHNQVTMSTLDHSIGLSLLFFLFEFETLMHYIILRTPLSAHKLRDNLSLLLNFNQTNKK